MDDGAILRSDAFPIHRARLRDLDVAYLREGVGGRPLLLIHGWPETKRIWHRNVAPLAAAGFEVIVPDLRGFGDTSVAADGFQAADEWEIGAGSACLHAHLSSGSRR